ncbi:BtrH N-terminal domain-containing protein [Paludifilum halophilum]|uniref:Butirosin biosynthesis protein H N-terminal domain-containing protein n=1 Tax=Paludifilum halophilum TaxID=1642702 RepID=A0A235B9Z5_9BACL|nr:BtrH N-terminal domain-containing protein [Paludifilum halophilum]OYD09091.1 hypothetical protein CHM34_04820 [Paludifilum halophilum]
MVTQKQIAGIEPFNDLFYKSCFFNSYFPIVRHYGKEIHHYLLNDLIVYDAGKMKREGLPDMAYIPVVEPERIMEGQGIQALRKSKSDDLVGDLKTDLQADRPVIIWVDPYFEAIRDDTYRKHHGRHSLLIYGFDDPGETFFIVEHRHRDNLSYEKQTIRYKELIDAYEGYHDSFRPGSDFSSYTAFDYDSLCGSETDGFQGKRLEDFVRKMGENYGPIAEGLDQLKVYIRSLEGAATAPERLSSDHEAVLKGLNRILNAKQVDRYRLAAFMEAGSSPLRLMDTIIEHWTFVRRTTAKQFFSGIFRPDAFAETIRKLNELYRLEQEFWRLLFQPFGLRPDMKTSEGENIG